MSIHTPPALHVVHRLLFDALLEMRSQGHEQKNKVVYHLADLFHQVALQMENAAKGQCGYEEVLASLQQRARERGCERWVDERMACLEERFASTDPAAH